MFDSPLGWCAVVRKWVALDEGVAECMRLQRCNMAVCPIVQVFAPVHPEAARGGEETAGVDDSCCS